ncbi:uncharacterized protein PAC_14233 [Phialocephala subalpina]|uniref:Uncharacterized protein n=1 Tax=Phialocephala subalpina TaxID=576137 RepID=A0A1L7XH03_9HELO|nr:uncharacterized protein PAC_14233 [Phialocephala subalpina]
MARLFSRLRRRRDQVVVFLHNIFKIERKMATPPSENAIVPKPEGDSEVSRMVINDTILRLVFETFLSRKYLLNTARVCWQWHRETMPHLNKVVDVTFSWTFHKDRVSKKGRNETEVNEDLLLRLKDQNSILSNQVREIRIIDYIPPDGIVAKRQRGSDFGAFGQLSEWAANDLILGPQGQLQQLVYVIPRLQLQGLRGVAWLGYPSAPDSFISMMSLHPSLDFKIGFGTARLPRERTESRQILIKFLTNIHATRVQNLTTFEYDIPAEPEGYSSMGMLGEVIRASPNLQTLSLFALPHPDSNQRTCPWAIDDGPVNKPFPTVKKLKLIGFGLDTLSATDRQAWKNLIQWDKLNSFTTDHKPFFNLHSTPNLKRLALLSPCGHVSSLPGEDDATRQALTGHTPLTHLVLYDEKLLSREVWNHHKQTLVSLTLHKTNSRLFINDLMFLPRLQHLAIDVTEGEQEWYDSSTMNHTKATTL